MKKKFFYAASIAVLGTAIFLQSCKKEEEMKSNPKSYASIAGYAYAELDLTNAEMETAPEGTPVVVTVNTSQYSNTNDAGVQYDNVSYAANIDANGRFQIDSVECYGNDVMVTVKFSDFTALTVLSDTEDERNVYSAGDRNVTLVSGLKKELDVTYNF